MNKLLNLIIPIAILFFAYSPAYSQVDENVFRDESSKNAGTGEPTERVMDMHLNFNADWHFHLGEIPGFHVPEFDDSDWRILDVPHDWSVEGQFAEENPSSVSGGYLPAGIACYRKYFVLPEGSKGKRIKIRFDGVYIYRYSLNNQRQYWYEIHLYNHTHFRHNILNPVSRLSIASPHRIESHQYRNPIVPARQNQSHGCMPMC